MEYYSLFLKAHSGWRYVVLTTLVIAILSSLAGWLGKKNYSPGNRKINLFALISAHIQFLLGLILYFMSPLAKAGDMSVAMKDSNLRYWTVEHTVMMLIAIALITIGHSKSKKLLDNVAKHRTVAIFYSIALIIIFVAITMIGDREAWQIR